MTSYELPIKQLSLKTKLQLRIATSSDIENLEWNGQFTHFRNLFRRAYIEQVHGNRLILITDFNGYPVARLFIQYIRSNSGKKKKKIRGYIYSFNVMEPFRNLGIGTLMLNTAETILIEQGYNTATISVAKENHRAFKLYRQNGYHVYGEDSGEWQYQDHEDKIHYVKEPCWLLRKNLTTQNQL